MVLVKVLPCQAIARTNRGKGQVLDAQIEEEEALNVIRGFNDPLLRSRYGVITIWSSLPFLLQR